jgi:hypothetical protein
MPLTPDRSPGPRLEEKITLTNDGYTADSSGDMVFDGTSFKFRDAMGEFDPRTGGSGITEAQHRVLRQLIHFIDDGPAEGFATGAYKEVLPAADPFPTSFIWWESSSKLKKIVELTVVYSGPFPVTEEWKMYDIDGSTVLATITDTVSYSGPFETSRTRAIVIS